VTNSRVWPCFEHDLRIDIKHRVLAELAGTARRKTKVAVRF
jgi:hypothetical protein